MTKFAQWLGRQGRRADLIGWFAAVAARDECLAGLPALCDWRNRCVTLTVSAHQYTLDKKNVDAQPPDFVGVLASAWAEYDGGRQRCFHCGGTRNAAPPIPPSNPTGLCFDCAHARQKAMAGDGAIQ